MELIRISNASGKEHTMDIPRLTEEEYQAWQNLGENRPHVQNAFSHLSADEREFIITGVTPEEWTQMFGEPED